MSEHWMRQNLGGPMEVRRVIRRIVAVTLVSALLAIGLAGSAAGLFMIYEQTSVQWQKELEIQNQLIRLERQIQLIDLPTTESVESTDTELRSLSVLLSHDSSREQALLDELKDTHERLIAALSDQIAAQGRVHEEAAALHDQLTAWYVHLQDDQARAQRVASRSQLIRLTEALSQLDRLLTAVSLPQSALIETWETRGLAAWTNALEAARAISSAQELEVATIEDDHQGLTRVIEEAVSHREQAEASFASLMDTLVQIQKSSATDAQGWLKDMQTRLTIGATAGIAAGGVFLLAVLLVGIRAINRLRRLPTQNTGPVSQPHVDSALNHLKKAARDLMAAR